MIAFTDTLDTFDRRDAMLLKRLGLKADNVVPWQETLLGKADLDDGVQVSVWVTSRPALFFRFDITSDVTGKQYRVETDSGDFTDYWDMVTAFVNGSLAPVPVEFRVREIVKAGALSEPSAGARILEEPAELLQDCSSCGTVYRFNVTTGQVLRYQPPRTELIQDIFPGVPNAARAVLSQGNICGLCLPQLNDEVKVLIRTFIAHNVD